MLASHSATVCTECFLHQGDRNIVFFSVSALSLALEGEEFTSTFAGYYSYAHMYIDTHTH